MWPVELAEAGLYIGRQRRFLPLRPPSFCARLFRLPQYWCPVSAPCSRPSVADEPPLGPAVLRVVAAGGPPSLREALHRCGRPSIAAGGPPLLREALHRCGRPAIATCNTCCLVSDRPASLISLVARHTHIISHQLCVPLRYLCYFGLEMCWPMLVAPFALRHPCNNAPMSIRFTPAIRQDAPVALSSIPSWYTNGGKAWLYNL